MTTYRDFKKLVKHARKLNSKATKGQLSWEIQTWGRLVRKLDHGSSRLYALVIFTAAEKDFSMRGYNYYQNTIEQSAIIGESDR